MTNQLEDRRLDRVRTYYRALDDHEYDRLEAILTEGFVHERPDRTITGRESFVTFMREGRPAKDTSHPLTAVYRELDGEEYVARGRLLDSDGNEITAFVDVFSFSDDRISHILTFTN